MDSLESKKDIEIAQIVETVTKAKKVSKAKSPASKLAEKDVVTEVSTAETVPTTIDILPQDEPAVPSIDSSINTVDYNTYSKSELLDALKVLINKDVNAVKDDVDYIKQVFYKKSKVDIEDQKKKFLEESGADEAEFIAEKDELEASLKDLLNQFRTKKAAYTALLDKEKDGNLLEKQQILEQMKKLVESNDDVSIHINEFRALQQKWKQIGQVPASASTDLWKYYSNYQESFWDLIKINNELREYDFKKNLEAKTIICESAEKLAQETEIIPAFQQLQTLHEEWHNLGPVARELRDQIWARFKEASTAINKKHQSHFDEVRKNEEENFAAKTTLCETIEAFDFSQITNYKGWDEATKNMLQWQEEWRVIGFAPRKVNQKIFDRYRKACDRFFAAKSEFYKESKNVLTQNLDTKKRLCEQAEALKDSTEWKESSDKLIQLQKEWKATGPVAKKFSDEIWKRFIAACDYFFEQKNKSTSGVRNEEAENLSKKKAIIARINSFEKTFNSTEGLTALRALIAEWNAVGHVPFKEKDKIYKEYKAAIDKQFELLNVEVSQRRLDTFRTNLKDMSSQGENKLLREREKMMRAYEHLKSEIATYENNIGFFTSSSKNGGGLIKEMERKIQALKEESKLIEQKINLIDEKI